MSTFVEFLLTQNHVSADVLAQVMSQQVKQMKTTAEVVFEQNLLQPEQYVRVLITQSQSGGSFQSACEAHGVWSSEFATKVREACEASCPALRDLLIAQGYLSAGQFESAAQSFQMSQQPNEVSSLVSIRAPTIIGLSALLQEQILPKLEPFARLNPWTTTQLRVCYHVLHQLAGIARFADAPTLEEIAKKTESVFEAASLSPAVTDETFSLCAAQIGLLVAVLRESVSPAPVASSSLDSFFDNLKALEQRLQPLAA